MASSGMVSQKQARFLLALASEPSVRSAASVAGVAERTAWRWLDTGPVADALRMQTSGLLTKGAADLAADVDKARRALVSVLDDLKASPGARIRAASAILQAALGYFELAALSARLAGIEERLNGGD